MVLGLVVLSCGLVFSLVILVVVEMTTTFEIMLSCLCVLRCDEKRLFHWDVKMLIYIHIFLSSSPAINDCVQRSCSEESRVLQKQNSTRLSLSNGFKCRPHPPKLMLYIVHFNIDSS
ncbi:hypothetical protein F5Y16DRAFT_374706, partial [Xylariaceae sp. FL0255]